MPIVTLSLEDKLELLKRDTIDFLREDPSFDAWFRMVSRRSRELTVGDVVQHLRINADSEILSVEVAGDEDIDKAREELITDARMRERVRHLHDRWLRLAEQWKGDGGRAFLSQLSWSDD